MQRRMKKGFTLLEIMVYILTSMILIAVASQSAGLIWQKIKVYMNRTDFEENRLIFLNRFEREWNFFIHNSENSKTDILSLNLKIDRNQDEDYEDSWEKLVYDYSPTVKRITLKSRSGTPQRLVNFVEKFQWKKSNEFSRCYEMVIQSIFSQKEKSILFCNY